MRDNTIEANKSLFHPLFISLTVVIVGIITLFNVLPKQSTLTLLEQIKRDGELIVVTRKSPTTYYEGIDGPAGLEYEMAKMFADEMGVKLKLLVPETLNDILNEISNNTAHIAAAGLTATTDLKKIFNFSPSYQEITEKLVYNRGNKRPKNLSHIVGGRLEVIANSSHAESLKHLGSIIPGLNWKENNKVKSEELLRMVSDNIIEYTIADSNILSLKQRYHVNLRAAFDVGDARPLAWILPKTDDDSLFFAVKNFINKIKENGELNRIIERTYGHVDDFDYAGTMIYRRHIETRLPTYQQFFEKAAKEQNVDWRLIAAMGYQESHWDPDSISPTGVRGIMMLTLKTAKDLNVKNRLDPESSISGGARYFQQTRERLEESVKEPDRTWMAMAAYNVGFYHLQDARKIARKLNKNPDQWVNVKQTLPLLAKRKWYKNTNYGYARGWEPVRYVENIRNYYDILKWTDESKIIITPVPKEFLKIPNSL